MGRNKMKPLKIKIFADGADINEIIQSDKNKIIDGFTTNPTLMAKAKVKNYMEFAKKTLDSIKEKPISFEVFSDELDEMYNQAIKLKKLGENVYVKIPISNTKNEYTYNLIKSLSDDGVKLNITAVFTQDHINKVYQNLNKKTKSIISIFAGRIANAGIDPEPIMKYASDLISNEKMIETLWASSREVFNIVQAERTGTNIITLPPNLISEMKNLGRDLDDYCLDTVKMFYNDAKNAGFSI